MNIEIVANNDENFTIDTVKFGEQFLASDGERICIKNTEEKATECVESLQNGENPNETTHVASNAAPLDNSRDGHPFDPFGGTSWDGKKQGFN